MYVVFYKINSRMYDKWETKWESNFESWEIRDDFEIEFRKIFSKETIEFRIIGMDKVFSIFKLP